MAKSSTRRINIYINGKEVEATVKGIRSEMNRSKKPFCPVFDPILTQYKHKTNNILL